MEQRHVKTPTEIAFEKAAQYDAILGFTIEHLAFEKPCDGFISESTPRIMTRYRLEWGSGAAIVIGHLENYLKLKSESSKL